MFYFTVADQIILPFQGCFCIWYIFIRLLRSLRVNKSFRFLKVVKGLSSGTTVKYTKTSYLGLANHGEGLFRRSSSSYEGCVKGVGICNFLALKIIIV